MLAPTASSQSRRCSGRARLTRDTKPLLITSTSQHFAGLPARAGRRAPEHLGCAAIILLQLQPGHPPAALKGEISDVVSWAYLGHYFALKLRGAVALQNFRAGGGGPAVQAEAVQLLTEAKAAWPGLVNSTLHLKPDIPLLDFGDKRNFSWAAMMPMVERDIQIAWKAGH